MTYASEQLIQASDYNGFVANNVGNVNAWWSTGSTDSGWGQTALGTVNTGETVTAATWASLVNTISAAGSHTGTTITSRTTPTVGAAITAMPGVDTDITSIYANRGNAAATGTVSNTWSGTASVTAATGTGNQNWTLTWTNTVNFASEDQARYFFNAGGLVRIQMNKSSTGTTKDSFWNSFVAAAGTLYVSSGIGATQSIGGSTYTGFSEPILVIMNENF